LDLKQIEIRPLSDETVVKGFCCGKEILDDFIKKSALKAESRSEMRTFCAHLAGSSSCIGFYALEVSTDTLGVRNPSFPFFKHHVPFPAVKLARLAVHRNYKRQGLGKHLLMDVFSRVADISKNVGIYALTLDSLDEESTNFYRSIGFAEYSNGTPPKMLYPVQDLLLVNKLDAEEEVAPCDQNAIS
jgi:GNAT superfamily N-acetyltransferase